ncbi:hypothetical protein MAR_010677 [Mya arenaria]|uniref:Uncharacterized protein n=1 Tax=Mya arenaria TaxID=6604 RepID=A0ABY7FRW8_MYAAR|nr:uncharacterized protein LOC128215786 isoform X2 [Mya arenaria]WAR24973.1 hypothetical protein MAR_010677 [Mya arenaria]
MPNLKAKPRMAFFERQNCDDDNFQMFCQKFTEKCYVVKCNNTENNAGENTPQPEKSTTPSYEGSQAEQKKPKDCPPQDCTAHSSSSGVSVGAAVGLLMLGLFLGAMVTTVICVCCPPIYAKASSILDKLKPGRGNLKDEIISNASEQKSRPMPSAPLPLQPADIRLTATTVQNANSGRPDSQHIYSESMDPSVGNTNSYDAYGYDHTNTNSSQLRNDQVKSPTYGYNRLANDVIPGTSSSKVAESAYQPLNANRSQSAEYSQIPGVRNDGDLRSQEHTDPSGAHQYFVLEKEAAMGSTETGLRDNDIGVPHDYFVLEKK